MKALIKHQAKVRTQNSRLKYKLVAIINRLPLKSSSQETGCAFIGAGSYILFHERRSRDLRGDYLSLSILVSASRPLDREAEESRICGAVFEAPNKRIATLRAPETSAHAPILNLNSSSGTWSG